MTDWQSIHEDDSPSLDGWYAILVSWGTPWEEDTVDILQFRNGRWIEKENDYHLPDFNYFQGPFQSSADALQWGHQNDPCTLYLVHRRRNA